MIWLKIILLSLLIGAPSLARKVNPKTTQQQLIHLAATIQNHEIQLSAIENELNQAREEEQTILNDLATYNQQLLDAIHYLRHATRYSQFLAMLSAPKPEDVIHTSMLLRSITPELNARNQQLLTKVSSLSQIRARLEDKQKQLHDLTFHYHQEHENLDALLQNRPRAVKLPEEREMIDDPSLILKPPVVGELIPTYGSSDPDHSSFTQGILFVTRSGAHVIAPVSGEIAFAGEYAQGQGKMVIIQMAKSHIVMSGFGSINCTVGDTITKGEPIGRMPIKLAQKGKDAAPSPQLYMEVWHQEQTVDPQLVLQKTKKVA